MSDARVVLQTRKLSKAYHMGELTVNALQDVDFSLYAGELTVLLGASGSGKSTLLNIIGGLDVPDMPPGLGAEYRVETSIIVWEADNVITAPGSALFQQANGWHVFVVEDDRAQLRSVEPGLRGRSHTQILSGLDAGELVILYPSDVIASGIRVIY